MSHIVWRSAAIALAAAVLASGCGSSESTGGASTSGGDKSDGKGGDIVLGEAIGVSGWLEAYDGPASEGAKLAIDEINAAGGVDGRKLKLITSDHQSEANLGPRAAQDVLEQGADILLTSCNYENAAPAARLANQQQKLVFSYCAGEPQFSRQSGDVNSLTFDMGNETNGVGASMAQFAHDKGWRSAYVLKDTYSNYTRQMGDFFTARWQAFGDTTIAGTDTFKNPDASIAGQIAKLKQSDADFLVIATTLPGGATAARQIRAAGIDMPIVTGDGMDSASVAKAVPNLSDFYQTVAASTYGDDPDPAVNEFFAKIEERTGKPADGSYAIFGYSIVQALKKAIEDAGSTDGPALKAALEKFDKEPLLVGPMTFTAEQHVDPTRPEKVLEMQDGKVRYLQTVQPTEIPDPF